MNEYTIGLLNYSFCKDYKNVRRYESIAQRNNYFKNKLTTDISLVNFNFNNLLDTVQTVTIELDTISVFNFNYAVVSKNGEPELFYFITSISQNGGTSFDLSLKLDAFTTYFNKANFPKSLIRRTHQSRFKKHWADTSAFMYDIEVDSDLLISEAIASQFNSLKLKESIVKNFYLTNTTAQENDLIHGKGWVWVIASEQPFTSQAQSRYGYRINGVVNPYFIYCFPVDTMIISGYSTSADMIPRVIDLTRVITMFYTPYAPFHQNSFDSEFLFSLGPANIPRIDVSNTNEDRNIYVTGIDCEGAEGCISFVCLHIRNQDTDFKIYAPETIKEDHTTYYYAGIDLIENYITDDLEPKLALSPFYKINISFGSDEGKDYSTAFISHNRSSPFNFRVREALIISPDGINRNAFIDIDDEYYKANLGTNTLILPSIPYSISVYQEYIANNKNAYMTGAGLPIITGAIKSASMPHTTLLNASSSLTSLAQFFSNLDNMKNAPQNYKGASVTAHATALNNNNKLIMSKWELVDTEKEQVKKYLYLYGYAYNHFANIKDFNIRSVFNYIEAEVEEVHGDVPVEAKDELINIFRNGVRMWNIDDVNYDNTNNIERWLLERAKEKNT